MTRQPPRPTLFPYTTLFRSIRQQTPSGGFSNASLNGGMVLSLTGRASCGRDRKSTRLNSSHRCISYAVFCLKKKKGSVHNNSRITTVMAAVTVDNEYTVPEI